MNNSGITKKRYLDMVEEVSPNSKTFSNCLKAFIIGGLVCVLGQGLTALYRAMGAEMDVAATFASVTLMFFAVLLTGFGIYDEMARFAGAGLGVPITGFANAVAAPAIEHKKEGFIFGVGSKIFIIAGPVIVYGVAASSVMGIFYWLIYR
ncbi:MAG: stage V sporulation protein AC [Defluviitaleaceae bacterium]|nr:stage V sporulation protein AC [Defluviitaleaceae bacterium]